MEVGHTMVSVLQRVGEFMDENKLLKSRVFFPSFLQAHGRKNFCNELSVSGSSADQEVQLGLLAFVIPILFSLSCVARML